jgi:superfamily I DNA/RNA helicase
MRTFRLVTVHYGDVVVVLHMGDHDSTQRWLDKNTGMEAVIDERDWRVEFTVPRSEPPWRVRQLQTEAITPSNIPFLQRVTGIDWHTAIPSKAARSFLLKFDEEGDDQELLDILEELRNQAPREADLCLTVINHLKEEQSGAAQAAVDVYLGIAKPASEAMPLTEEVFRAEPNQGRFVILNDLDDAQLERYYDPLRFQDWMLCLHAGQSRVVVEDYPGPVLLTGVSGSGKTCVLVHRASRMARTDGEDRVLVLTMNQSLARLIQNLVSRLCINGEQQRIVVRSFQEYLADLLRSLDCEPFLRRLADFTGMSAEVEAFLTATPQPERLKIFHPMSERAQMQAFEEFLAEPGNPAKVEFDRLEVFVFSQDQTTDLRRYLFEELELVRSAFSCYADYKGYMDYSRHGRCIAFQENRRAAILNILREWERFQLRRGFLDLMGLTQAAIFAADEQGAIPEAARYRWVLVDEFQDISTLGLDLLRRVPTAEANGLFLTGDFAQKIYAKDLDLPKANLGRDRRTDRVIRRNYRNSRQILRAAFALTEKYPPQVGSEDGEIKILEPEYAKRETAVPIATEAANQVQAAWHYAKQWLDAGNIPFSVCIVTANPDVISVADLLSARPKDLEADELTGDYLLNTQRVVVSDMPSVKGFEFSLIIICALGQAHFPPKGVPAEEHWREAMRLYVAITRGRGEVRFIYSEVPSPFIQAMNDFIQFQTWVAPAPQEPAVEPPAVEVPPPAQPPAEAPPQPAESLPAEAIPQEPTISKAEPEAEPAVEAKAAPVQPVHVAQPLGTSEAPPAVAPAPQPPPAKPIPRDGMEAFLWRHTTQVLNGILIVPVPIGSNQWQLARALGLSQTAVSIECQRAAHFTNPNTRLSDHIVREMCDKFNCAPKFLPL